MCLCLCLRLGLSVVWDLGPVLGLSVSVSGSGFESGFVFGS